MKALEKALQGMQELFQLPDSAMEDLYDSFQLVEVAKRGLLTEAGQVENYMYFIESGVQRSYFIHKDKEITFQFTYPPGVTGVPESFFLQEPSRFFLECLTPSRLWRLPYAKVEEYCEKYPEVARWRQISVEKLLSQIIHKQMEQLSMSSKERFTVFMKRSPHLFQLVPQKYIASYLGMSPETFSVMLNTVRLES